MPKPEGKVTPEDQERVTLWRMRATSLRSSWGPWQQLLGEGRRQDIADNPEWYEVRDFIPADPATGEGRLREWRKAPMVCPRCFNGTVQERGEGADRETRCTTEGCDYTGYDPPTCPGCGAIRPYPASGCTDSFHDLPVLADTPDGERGAATAAGVAGPGVGVPPVAHAPEAASGDSRGPSLTAPADPRREAEYETDWSPEALRKARELFIARTDDGRVQLAICVECGVWARWDSEVTQYGKCFDGNPHRVSRVNALATDPPESGEGPSQRDLLECLDYVTDALDEALRCEWKSKPDSEHRAIRENAIEAVEKGKQLTDPWRGAHPSPPETCPEKKIGCGCSWHYESHSSHSSCPGCGSKDWDNTASPPSEES